MRNFLLKFYNELDCNLIESIPIVILGMVLFALYKHTSKKKLWLVLGCIPLVVIVVRTLQWVICKNLYEMAIVGIYVTAFYGIGCLIGNFFNPRKIWHWVVGPVALLLVFLIPNIVSYFSKDYLHPFGTIVDEPLALDSADSSTNNLAGGSSPRFDYELKISFSDAFVFDIRMATIRVKGDSALICTSKKVCGVLDSVETCEWKTSESVQSMAAEPKSVSKIHELKKLVESYKEEMISYDVFDGNIFEVTLLDYRRGVKRYLDISNTWVGKPDEVPNAKRIDQMADPFLPIDENSPIDWEGKKCRDSETKDTSNSENLTTNHQPLTTIY